MPLDETPAPIDNGSRDDPGRPRRAPHLLPASPPRPGPEPAVPRVRAADAHPVVPPSGPGAACLAVLGLPALSGVPGSPGGRIRLARIIQDACRRRGAGGAGARSQPGATGV